MRLSASGGGDGKESAPNRRAFSFSSGGRFYC